jgi:CHAT domain
VDDNGFEYTVIVRDGTHVSASVRYAHGRTPPPVPEQKIELSQLHRDTIRILQDWLSRWGVLSRVAAQYKSLCVPGTFEVLGQYLYKAIFPDPIAKGFDDAKREAKKQGAQLQVVLRFEQNGDGHDDLAAFAWEFLYHPPDPSVGREGFFIGAETNLTLSRLLAFDDKRPELPKSVLPLRVLFVVSTPESLEGKSARSLEIQLNREQEREYAEDRGKLIKLLSELPIDLSGLEVQPIYSWDSFKISKALGERAFNIIHVVGVCRSRSASGDVEMALPGADGSPTWQSAQVLVDLLGQEAQRGHLGLVVLHLCEASRSDYTATFERLAPKVVQAGIPAVLAMQYPVPANKATSFTENFYRLLTEGKEIGQAVQEARRSLLAESRGDRGFGTPVLYLQSVDGRLLGAATISGPGPVVDPHRAASETLADQVRQAVRRSDVDAETALELADWINTIDWSDDRWTLAQRISARLRDDPGRYGQVLNGMLDIVENYGAGR